jgi:Skp family chaperone for outer membrane proteins
MKTLFAAMPFALLSLLLPQATGRQGQPQSRPVPSVAYVSPQRILAESTEGKNQVAKFQALQQQKATDLRVKQQALEGTRQQLAQATDAASRAQLQQNEQQQRTELERATGQAQAEMQALQRQAQNELNAKVKPVVEEVAKAQNIQLVLSSDVAVVWASPSLDLTAAVIGRMNAPPAGPATNK